MSRRPLRRRRSRRWAVVFLEVDREAPSAVSCGAALVPGERVRLAAGGFAADAAVTFSLVGATTAGAVLPAQSMAATADAGGRVEVVWGRAGDARVGERFGSAPVHGPRRRRRRRRRDAGVVRGGTAGGVRGGGSVRGRRRGDHDAGPGGAGPAVGERHSSAGRVAGRGDAGGHPRGGGHVRREHCRRVGDLHTRGGVRRHRHHAVLGARQLGDRAAGRRDGHRGRGMHHYRHTRSRSDRGNRRRRCDLRAEQAGPLGVPHHRRQGRRRRDRRRRRRRMDPRRDRRRHRLCRRRRR